MKLTNIAKKLFEWNSTNLTKHSALKKADIDLFFAHEFRVFANGRNYEANSENYFDFLQAFRSSIHSICYTFHDFIEAKDSVIIAFAARIQRVDDKIDNFEAVLILKFNPDQKIVLWHEIYVSSP
jgi:hypothetical protein